MTNRLDEEFTRPGRDRPLEAAFCGPHSGVGRAVAVAFVLASVCHLLLADAWQIEWLAPNLIYLFGLVLIAWRGAALGWFLSALGLAIPLVFLRDQLTQSLILLLIASTAAVALAIDGYRTSGRDRPEPLDTSRGLMQPGEWTLLAVCRGMTIVTYALAALHKLNHDYVDPDYSCAAFGVEELFEYWNVPLDAAPEWLALAAPWLVLGAEGGIALLHALGLRRPAWIVAIAFHIPLTVTMAPAFVFVMLVGHAAFLRPDDLRRVWEMLRAKWLPLGLAATALTAASLLAHQNLPEWTMIPREWLLWALLGLLLTAFAPWRAETWTRTPPPDTPAPTRARLAAGAVVALFVFNGLTPYLGLQFQHTGAMVSNLRIDEGCWNSLVFPEAMRMTDDYIRFDEVYLGEPGRSPKYERIVKEELWDIPRLHQMRKNWCREDDRPFYLRGTFRNEEFTIDDLCADDPLPLADKTVFGSIFLKNYLRFQKNLQRDCPQACIH